MALIDVSTITVPSHTEYSATDPTKQQENLAYINEQLWEMMKQAGFVLTDNQMDQAEKDAFQTLWDKQNDLIQQQSDYLDDVKDTFNAKADSLPSGFSVEDLIAEYGGSVAYVIVSYFFGTTAGSIAKFAVEVIGLGIDILEKLYTAGGGYCDTMKEENDALLNLPFSKENYQIRSQIMTQHSHAIDNLLSHIMHAEEQVSEGFRTVPSSQESEVLQEISETLKQIEAHENIINLDGVDIWTESGVINWGPPE